jgi:hypothetical protein
MLGARNELDIRRVLTRNPCGEFFSNLRGFRKISSPYSFI